MKIHFIGIGGIGVSALAQYYLEKGHDISGSDLAQSEITDFLAAKGIKIFIGNKAEHIASDIDMVVYSPAVKPENPEYMAAKNTGISLKSYPQALGELTREYKTIAISGSHGKSTITAMVALILIKAGIDPTVIVGTKLKEFKNSNFRMGQGNYLVIEACEYDGSFLEYSPNIAVITNIDKEHLDYFGDFDGVKKAFSDFIMRLTEDGKLIFNSDDNNIVAPKNSLGYSLSLPEAKKIREVLQVPGDHNISNALAALSVARILGVDDEISFAALAEFTGTWRRFEVTEKTLNATRYTLISDYGHHPTEVAATFQAARQKYPDKKIWCIFQPHQHQRTYYLFSDFIELFKKTDIDEVIITDIYDVAGREEKNINASVSSELLVEKIGRKQVQYMHLVDAEKFVKEHIKSGEVLIIMGAGDVYKLAEKF